MLEPWGPRALLRATFLWILLALAAAADVRAQACAGFTDVDAASPFCPYVEWMKNRAITTGCTSTTVYCPDNTVTRLQMAAFMNRLSKALSVQALFVEGGTGTVTIPSGPTAELRCITADTAAPPPNYPRSAIVGATLSGLADVNAVAWKAAIVYSSDAGATWHASPASVGGMRASSGASEWSNVAVNSTFDLAPGLSYRFAISILRDDVLAGTTGNFTAGRCQLTARVVNRNGASSPYDAQ